MTIRVAAADAAIKAGRWTAADQLAYLRSPREREVLTDDCGATVSRLMVWPERRWQPDTHATAGEIAVLRGLLGGGDAVAVTGPLEHLVNLPYPFGLNALDAMEEASNARG